ncbi:MAG: HlyD family efflux transporter periplasmic adaptor subunit [Bacteroidetes bacterium]|nr:HlyD family efflux transporter periplasmic adaptor subunit [Bacteroidota bacterium]
MINQEELTQDPDQIKLTGRQAVNEAIGRPPSSVLTYGPAIISCMLIMLLLLSWFIQYPDIISAKAVITTLSPPQKEIARISGKLDSVFVTDNQLVSPGTPLAVIENSARYADVAKLKLLLNNSGPDDFPFEQCAGLSLGEIGEDYSKFETAYILFQLNDRLQPFDADSYSGMQNKYELSSRESTLLNQLSLAEKEMQLREQDLDRYRTLHKQGVVPAEELEQKQLAAIEAGRSLKAINLALSQLRENKNINNRNLRNAEFNKTRENVQLRNSLQQAHFLLKKSLRDWELKYLLQADIQGRVSFINYWSKNQSVIEGELIFAIIPDQKSGIVARVRTPSLKSGKVKAGQTVNLKLESYPGNEFGILKGRVTSVSVVPDKEGFYQVNVDLPSGLVTTYQKEIVFRQEMRADAEIITEELRLVERFFYHFKNLWSNS